eukprot:6180682-Pleurochrysis_carterae.AAC.5
MGHVDIMGYVDMVMMLYFHLLSAQRGVYPKGGVTLRGRVTTDRMGCLTSHSIRKRARPATRANGSDARRDGSQHPI